jgi:hypothetical protein
LLAWLPQTVDCAPGVRCLRDPTFEYVDVNVCDQNLRDSPTAAGSPPFLADSHKEVADGENQQGDTVQVTADGS